MGASPPINEERRRVGRHTPLLVINFTMTRHNAAASLRRLCAELVGKQLVDVVSIKSSPIWMPQKKGEAYDNSSSAISASGASPVGGFVEDYGDFDAAPARWRRPFAS